MTREFVSRESGLTVPLYQYSNSTVHTVDEYDDASSEKRVDTRDTELVTSPDYLRS